MAADFAALMQKPVAYHAVTAEAGRRFGFSGAEYLGNMFQFKRDFEKMYCASRNVIATCALNPQLMNFLHHSNPIARCL